MTIDWEQQKVLKRRWKVLQCLWIIILELFVFQRRAIPAHVMWDRGRNGEITPVILRKMLRAEVRDGALVVYVLE